MNRFLLPTAIILLLQVFGTAVAQEEMFPRDPFPIPPCEEIWAYCCPAYIPFYGCTPEIVVWWVDYAGSIPNDEWNFWAGWVEYGIHPFMMCTDLECPPIESVGVPDVPDVPTTPCLGCGIPTPQPISQDVDVPTQSVDQDVDLPEKTLYVPRQTTPRIPGIHQDVETPPVPGVPYAVPSVTVPGFGGGEQCDPASNQICIDGLPWVPEKKVGGMSGTTPGVAGQEKSIGFDDVPPMAFGGNYVPLVPGVHRTVGLTVGAEGHVAMGWGEIEDVEVSVVRICNEGCPTPTDPSWNFDPTVQPRVS